MTTKRRGERIGWLGGWIGGFSWVAILSFVFLYQKKFGYGLFGLFLTAVALATILYGSPWRYPLKPYWKLMLAPYGMFFAAIVWVILAYGGHEPFGFNWWNLLWLIPALTPFGFLSNKTWEGSDAQQNASSDTGSTNDQA